MVGWHFNELIIDIQSILKYKNGSVSVTNINNIWQIFKQCHGNPILFPAEGKSYEEVFKWATDYQNHHFEKSLKLKICELHIH